jgi:eukaryotic-like serine/threonine-protein kinase
VSDTPRAPIGGRYRLVRPLGQGGMGRVWHAWDEILRRDVAVKELVPPPGLSEDEQRDLRERAMREARTVARLNQVNVVRIYDVLYEDGKPWIVMELVASRPLHVVLRQQGPMAPAQAARIGLSVLAALQAAHAAGVLHRDVKPANVLLADDGRVVLTDFGLATASGDPGMTHSGVVLGSPAYLAPERATDGPVGPASDLWSLGATLYAAVEGRSPYARTSAIATLAALATDEPPPAPRHAGALTPVLAGLLERDPDERIDLEEAYHLLRDVVDAEDPDSLSPAAAVRPVAARPEPAVPSSTSGSWARAVAGSRAGATAKAAPAGVAPAGPAAAAEPRSHKRRWLAGVAVVLILLAGGLLMVRPDLNGNKADAAGSRPAAAAPSQPETAGWHYYRDDPDFSMPVPDGWKPVRTGRHIEFREPGGPRVLTVDELESPPSDLTAHARSREKADRKSYAGYARIGVRLADYQSRAVDREWTYVADGNLLMHAVSRTFVGENGRAFSLGWRAPGSSWVTDETSFTLVLDGFREAEARVKPSPRPSRSAGPKPTPKPSKTTTAPPLPTAPGQLIRNQATDTCLDVPNSDANTTAGLQIWACTGTPGQLFTLASDRSVKVLGRCLEIGGDTDGSPLHLATCNGGGRQMFTLSPAADLVSLQVDKCVEVPDANPALGTVVRIWTCLGPSQQKWFLAAP